jgi:hypothetical protein
MQMARYQRDDEELADRQRSRMEPSSEYLMAQESWNQWVARFRYADAGLADHSW